MDYSLFSFRSCIDWIELEIQTIQQTNSQTVRRKLYLLQYVEMINPGRAGESKRFRIRIQDPQSWKDIENWIKNVESHFPFAIEPTITAIEVSFDAYSAGATEDYLHEMAATFYTFSASLVSNNHRFGGRQKGDVTGIFNTPQISRFLKSGRVINIGNRADSKSQRIYVKTKDGGTGPNKPQLPVEQHRARIEVTLQGEALPFTSLEQAKAYNFTQLAKFFKFRKQKNTNYSPEALAALSHAPVRGTRAERRVTGNSYRLYATSTKADIELNARAYDALKGLTRSLNRRTNRGRKPRQQRISPQGQ